MKRAWMPVFAGLVLCLFAGTASASAGTIRVTINNPGIHVLDQGVQDTPISIWVDDNRASPVLGKALHGESIVTNEDVAIAIKNSLAGSLRAVGFQVLPLPSDKSNDLHVHLTSLTYKAVDGFLTSKAILTSRVSATVTHGNWHVDRTLDSSEEHTVPLSPNARDITKFVNEIVTDTVISILNDPQLFSALQGHPIGLPGAQ